MTLTAEMERLSGKRRDFGDQACRDRLIAVLVDETLQGKLSNNGHPNKKKVILAFCTVVEIAKNYESSTDAKRLMRQMRGDQESTGQIKSLV